MQAGGTTQQLSSKYIKKNSSLNFKQERNRNTVYIYIYIHRWSVTFVKKKKLKHR